MGRTMSKLDIKEVYAINQDFTNKTVSALSKEGYVMWTGRYTTEETFNKAFREMYKKLRSEMARRESMM